MMNLNFHSNDDGLPVELRPLDASILARIDKNLSDQQRKEAVTQLSEPARRIADAILNPSANVQSCYHEAAAAILHWRERLRREWSRIAKKVATRNGQ